MKSKGKLFSKSRRKRPVARKNSESWFVDETFSYEVERILTTASSCQQKKTPKSKENQCAKVLRTTGHLFSHLPHIPQNATKNNCFAHLQASTITIITGLWLSICGEGIVKNQFEHLW